MPRPFQLGGLPRTPFEGWTELPQLHAAWLALTEKERRHLRIPLSRLNLAQRRDDLVDAAIDLGVSIDSLFLSEREADRGEQTLTLRLRAARFLGHDPNSRRDLAKLFNALYRLRSAAVHTGAISPMSGGYDTHMLIKKGYELTASAIRKIILEGEPDWNALLYT